MHDGKKVGQGLRRMLMPAVACVDYGAVSVLAHKSRRSFLWVAYNDYVGILRDCLCAVGNGFAFSGAARVRV